MKKLMVVLIMGLCGSAVFAQDSTEKISAEENKVKTQRISSKERPGAIKISKEKPSDVTIQKNKELMHKLNLLSIKAVTPEQNEVMQTKTTEK